MVDEGTLQRVGGWLGEGCVFEGAFPKQAERRCWKAVGSAYSAVRGAICLKLPSVAILPWAVGSLLRKSAIKNNALPQPTPNPLKLFYLCHYDIRLFCCLHDMAISKKPPKLPKAFQPPIKKHGAFRYTVGAAR